MTHETEKVEEEDEAGAGVRSWLINTLNLALDSHQTVVCKISKALMMKKNDPQSQGWSKQQGNQTWWNDCVTKNPWSSDRLVAQWAYLYTKEQLFVSCSGIWRFMGRWSRRDAFIQQRERGRETEREGGETIVAVYRVWWRTRVCEEKKPRVVVVHVFIVSWLSQGQHCYLCREVFIILCLFLDFTAWFLTPFSHCFKWHRLKLWCWTLTSRQILL